MMSRNRQHQWEPVAGPDNLVRCKKCGTEVKASRARRGAGPCIWGDAAESPPVSKEEDNIKGRLSLSEDTDEATIGELVMNEESPEENLKVAELIELSATANLNIRDGEPTLQRSGPRLTDPPEYCNACGDQIAILPLNSRLDMAACNNRHCALYRERLRMVTKPTKRGKQKRGNNS